MPLGSLLASLLVPLGRPNRPKFTPKCLLNACLHEKRGFCSRICFSNTKMVFPIPRWPPKCPKIVPRRLQEGLEKHLFSTSFLPSILVRFWYRFGSLLAPFWAPKTTLKSIQKSIKNRLAARWPPRPPKGLPRRSPDSPGPPQDPPRPSQNAPESLPGPSWTIQKIKNFEIVENLSNKRSTMVAHNGHSIPSLERIESQFTTVEPPRVAAVVARSALQSAAPGRRPARRVVDPPGVPS